MSEGRSRRQLAAALGAVLLLGLGLWLLRPGPSSDRPVGAPDAAAAALAHRDAGLEAWFSRGVAVVGRDGGVSPATPRPGGGLTAGWGSGTGQLGRSIPQEGNPEAPMSFAIAPGGRAVVLDQVNGRLSRFGPDGRPLESVPVTQQAPQDVTVAKDGTTLVLDRVKDKTVAVLKDGQLVGDLPVEGKGIPEGGGVTGVFTDGKDVYVEREHGSLVRVGDTDGKADPDRPEIPGRPTRDGKSFILAGLVDAAAGRAFVSSIDRASMDPRFTRELRLGQPVLALVLLDTDLSGTLYLGALAEHGALKLLCLSGTDGAPIGSADIPANSGPEETFRDLVVLDGGGVVYAQRTEQGVSYLRYDCR